MKLIDNCYHHLSGGFVGLLKIGVKVKLLENKINKKITKIPRRGCI